jgi:hypothetical protein
LEAILCIWLPLCLLVAVWAGNWGRSGGLYFFVSLVCSPLLAAIVLLIEGKNVKAVEKNAVAAGDHKKCPYCAELIKKEAIKCRHCGSDLPAAAP